jgi:hypothetical protein
MIWPLVPVAWAAGRILLHTDARLTLERRILPPIARDATFPRILFVGCEWYTWRYAWLFRRREYWTIERRPEASRHYGGPRAIADDVGRLDRHFDAGALDVVICNGVLGWGVDSAEAAAAMFAQIHRALRPGGLFVLGWTNGAPHRPVDIDTTSSLRGFEPSVFPPLGTARHLTQNPLPHVFSFFRKAHALPSVRGSGPAHATQGQTPTASICDI